MFVLPYAPKQYHYTAHLKYPPLTDLSYLHSLELAISTSNGRIHHPAKQTKALANHFGVQSKAPKAIWTRSVQMFWSEGHIETQ